jgi:hypothetical protein
MCGEKSKLSDAKRLLALTGNSAECLSPSGRHFSVCCADLNCVRQRTFGIGTLIDDFKLGGNQASNRA